MRKKHIIVLSVILGIALGGLIIIQANYFLTAYSIREAQFEYAVNRALSEITTEIEERDGEILEKAREEWRSRRDSVPALGAPGTFHIDSSGNTASLHVTIGGVAFTDMFGEMLRIEDFGSFAPSRGWTFGAQGSFGDRMEYGLLFDDGFRNIPVEERLANIPLEEIIRANLEENDVDSNFEYAIKLGNRYIFLSDKFYNKPSEDGYVYKRKVFLAGAGGQTFVCLIFPAVKHSVWQTVMFVAPTLLITLLIIFVCIFCLLEIIKEKRLSSIKNDFINNMTHEFKTPIATISLASQMLKDGSVSHTSESVGRIAGIVLDESKRLTMLVEKVLQTALFSEKRMRLKKKNVSVNELVENVVAKFALRVEDRGGALHTHLDAGNDEVYADEVHLTNIFSNLLDNAIKYCTRAPEISVYTRDSGGDIIISVVDNGIGISAKEQKLVFERFYRVATGNIHDVKGFGLGLSYVKMITEAHGGRVAVESQEGKGSRFDVILPLVGKK